MAFNLRLNVISPFHAPPKRAIKKRIQLMIKQ